MLSRHRFSVIVEGQTLAFILTGKLHRALRLSVEHIPDVGLQDIEEEDEETEEEIESENEFDEEDAPKDVMLNQDGVTSDDTDIELFSKSHNCKNECLSVSPKFSKGFMVKAVSGQGYCVFCKKRSQV